MDIAGLSMALGTVQASNDVSTAVLSKSLDTMEEMGNAMTKMMEQSVMPHLGQNIDVKLQLGFCGRQNLLCYFSDNGVSEIEKEQFVVDGYQFETEKQARQAKKEAEGVQYTKEHLNMANPEEVLKVYNRILRDKMFSTPVGYSFLRDLQEYLYASPAIQKKDVHPIDFQPVIEKAKEEDKEALQIKKKKLREKHKEEDRQKKARAKQRKDEQKNDYRGRLVSSIIINIALVLVVVAMFVIMRMSDVPTIIDYENKLIDKYEKWEQDLTERENRIREYEEKYDITDGY